MGIALTTAQQNEVFTAYLTESKTSETSALNNTYSGFLKLLHDLYPATNRALILLNKFLNPAWFNTSDFDGDDFIDFNSLLESYITTTDDKVRAADHRRIVSYLKNDTIPNLFLPLVRTKVILPPFTDTVVSGSYVLGAAGLPEIGSLIMDETFNVGIVDTI